ncbi:undecaprenyl-diphosphate phosphatase [Bacillus fonticola]|uniref:undecaprenyl-diphosphate phosphatase n=1 Tax=Bacillus fonticola TaxID=2728853 RepID=UPI00147390E1|nr:undecaprenyl-diphosphate phosphatase [Bacillus fonticola]
MSKIEAFLLGIIQGLTEFLPISSTGHLYIGRQFFDLEEAGLFLDTMLHLGTLLAVLVVYHKELLSILRNPFQPLTLLLVIGTIPAVIAALLFGDVLESISVSGVTIPYEFLFTGFILFWAVKNKGGSKSMEDLTWRDGLIIGSFQAVAILPAVSRSALTIAAGLFCKMDRASAAYFSFFLSIPVISGGVVLQGRELFQGGVEVVPFSSLLVATIAASLFGYFAIVWLLKFLQQKSLTPFAIYVTVLGLVILVLQQVEVL